MKKLILLALLCAVPVSAETRIEIPGCIYADVTTQGHYVAVIKDSHVQTNSMSIELPAGGNLLYARMAADGQRFAGVGNRDDRAYEWADGKWNDRGMAFGVNAVIYDVRDVLRIVWGPGTPTGSQGYRNIGDDGVPVTGDESYADPVNHLWEYSIHGDVRCGQGGDENGLQCLVRGRRVLVEQGVVRFIRYRREGDAIALAWTRFDTGSCGISITSASELDALPTYEIPGNPPPPPPPPPPVQELPDPIAARRIVEEERAKFGSMDAEQVAAFLFNVARRMNAEGLKGGPFGALVKTSGSQCAGYSCDIICSGDGDKQRQWDVLGDADPGGAQTAGWSGPLNPIVVRSCELPLGPPPPPPPPPFDEAKYIAVINALRDEIARLNLHIADEDARHVEELVEAQNRIAALEATVEAQLKEIERLRAVPPKECEVTGAPGWLRRLFGIGCSVKEVR